MLRILLVDSLQYNGLMSLRTTNNEVAKWSDGIQVRKEDKHDLISTKSCSKSRKMEKLFELYIKMMENN